MKNAEISQNWFTYVGFKGEKENGFICPEGQTHVCTDYVEVRIDPKDGNPLWSLIDYTEKDWWDDNPDAIPFIEKDGKHKGNYISPHGEWTMNESVDRIVGYIHFTHDTHELCFASFEVGSINSRENCDIKQLLSETEYQEIIDYALNCIKADLTKENEFSYWNYAEDAKELGVIDIKENTKRTWMEA